MSWSIPVKIGFDLPELRAVENCTCSKCFNTESAELGAHGDSFTAAAAVTAVWMSLLRHRIVVALRSVSQRADGALNKKLVGAKTQLVVGSQSLMMICNEQGENWGVWMSGIRGINSA